MSDRRDRAEDEFRREVEALEAEGDRRPPGAPEESRPLPPAALARKEKSLRTINALTVTLAVILFVVVVPATLALGGLGMLGACYDTCTDLEEAVVFVGFLLIPVGYVVLSVRWLKRLRDRVEADPAHAEVMTPGSVVLTVLLVVLLVLAALVVTCFGLLGLLGATAIT